MKLLRNERGGALLEMVIVLGLLSTLAVSGFQLMNRQHRMQLCRIAAEQTRAVMGAAEGYVFRHQGDLARRARLNPVAIGMDELRKDGLLPPSAGTRNPWGQEHAVLVRLPDSFRGESLEVLVLTHGGEKMEGVEGSGVALAIGAAGGIIGADGTASGAAGGWKISMAPWAGNDAGIMPAEGHVAVFMPFDHGNLVSNHLHRYAIPGWAEANRMHTRLDMNKNSISGISTLEVGCQKAGEAQFKTLNMLHELRCPEGRMLTRSSDGTFRCVVPDTIPAGLIAAFSGPCPSGWDPHTGAAGRFLVGAGTLGTDTYAIGSTGGAARVTLDISQIPAHTHTYQMGTGEQTWAKNEPANAQNHGGPVGVTNPAGGGQAHENRPPWLAVNYCRKKPVGDSR